MRLDALKDMAERAIGLRYDSAEAQTIHGEGDWYQYYPEVDGYGYLTGRVIDGNDDRFLVVDDLAMVEACTLSAEEIQLVDEGWFPRRVVRRNDMNKFVLSDPPGGRGYVYYPGATLTAIDLREEMEAALERGEEGIETAIIVPVDEAHGGLLLENNECGQALYIHSLGRIGIAWGAYADWADADSLAEGIRMYHEGCPARDSER